MRNTSSFLSPSVHSAALQLHRDPQESLRSSPGLASAPAALPLYLQAVAGIVNFSSS